jgi:hypothetical protein
MPHTFLLRPGQWSVHGRFFDARYRLTGAHGELQVRHEPLAWIIQGRLELEDGGKSLELDCSVAPSDGGAAASWSWLHPRLGKLEGAFELAGRRMFSTFRGRDGTHSGQATFTQKNDDSYLAEGELRRERSIVCSWELTLRRRRLSP